MKTWTFITLLLVSTNLMAQKSATAVMNVSVTVISGTSVSSVQNIDINFDDETIINGGYEITTPNSLDASFGSEDFIILTNQFGEEIILQSDSSMIADASTKKIKVGANIDTQYADLRGNYTGTITTTIAYY